MFSIIKRLRTQYGRVKPRTTLPRAVFFHGVTLDEPDDDVQINQISFTQFKKCLDMIQKNYKIIPMRDLLSFLYRKTKIPDNSLVISFDDGYENNYNVVHAEMRSRGLEYSIFVCPDLVSDQSRVPTYYLRAAIFHTNEKIVRFPYIDKTYCLGNIESRRAVLSDLRGEFKRLDSERQREFTEFLKRLMPPDKWLDLDVRYSSEKLMSWQQIAELNSEGVEIGSHTLNHAILHHRQSDGEINNQVICSKKSIENALGIHISTFCYPNGTESDICDNAIAAARRAGYSLGFTNIRGTINAESEPLMLPRYGMLRDAKRSMLELSDLDYWNERYHQVLSVRRASI